MLGNALKCVVEVRPAQGCDYVTDTLSQLVLEIHCRYQVSECIIASFYSARPMFTWHCNCQPHGPVHQYFSLVTCNDCRTYYFSRKNKKNLLQSMLPAAMHNRTVAIFRRRGPAHVGH